MTLLDLLDRLVHKGVVLGGDLILSVADVDLVYVGLKVLVSSVETMREWCDSVRLPVGSGNGNGGFELSADLGDGLNGPPLRMPQSNPLNPLQKSFDSPSEPERIEQGLAKLVLTLIDLLRQLLERQAIRRMEGGSLTDEQVERMGQTFLKLEEKMEELKRTFGLSDDDLDIKVGTVGDFLEQGER